MTTDKKSYEKLLSENEELRGQISETEDILRAIQSGEVDALVVSRPKGEQVFTLQGAEYPYRVLVETMNEGAATLDSDGTIVYCNRRLATILQVPLEKLIGSKLESYVDPKDYPLFSARLKTYTQEGAKEEIALITGSGNLMPVLFSCCAVELTKSRGVSVLLTDISARKKAERKVSRLNEELEKRVQELEETYRKLEGETGERVLVLEELRKKERLLIQQSRMAAMGEMLNNIAHQWRQPLNVLGLKVQEIGLTFELGNLSQEILDENIDRVMDIIKHMSQTIDDFRDFSAPDKEKSLFMVDRVIAKTISLLKENFTQLGIAIEVSTSGEQINGYPNEYGQVLLNILMNAKDAFREQRTKGAKVTLYSRMEEGVVVLTITDNAGGINKEIMDKIFDPYFTTKELGKGTGIGLFMSKTIIEKNMGGSFSVSNVEGGAEFRIEV